MSSICSSSFSHFSATRTEILDMFFVIQSRLVTIVIKRKFTVYICTTQKLHSESWPCMCLSVDYNVSRKKTLNIDYFILDVEAELFILCITCEFPRYTSLQCNILTWILVTIRSHVEVLPPTVYDMRYLPIILWSENRCHLYRCCWRTDYFKKLTVVFLITLSCFL